MKDAVVDVVVVQHAEKVKAGGDVALTDAGRAQAAEAAAVVARCPWDRLVTSTMRRAIETGAPIEAAIGVAAEREARIRERMNWPGPERQTVEQFLDDWRRATRDRTWTPPTGESSAAAGARFVGFLDEVRTVGVDRVLLVSHGGVTVDMARTLFGDAAVQAMAPDAIDDGLPTCTLTHVRHVGDTWSLRAMAADAATVIAALGR